MKPSLVSGLVLLGALLLAPPVSAADGPFDFVTVVDRVVDEAVAAGFAGGVAVWDGDAWLYSRVVGSADNDGAVPVTETTRFHVASATKYFTAVLVLKAIEEGKLAPDASVGELVGDAELSRRGVTVEQLLSHVSGLGSSYAAERHGQAPAALKAIVGAGYEANKVGTFRYANDGYDLLSIVLERAYGTTYEELSRQLLVEPAQLASVRFWGLTDLTDPQLVGQPLRKVSRRLRKRNYGMLGSSGLLITAADLVRFQRALKRGELLDEASRAALWAPRSEMSLGHATYGAFLMSHPQLGRVLSARGYQEWGDNAILNDYLDAGMIVAVVTSKGPAEGTGEPFRSRIAKGIEVALELRLAGSESRQ